MCWYIVETLHGSVALDGEIAAIAFHQAHRGANQWTSKPRLADPNDLVDRTAVADAEERLRVRRAEREYAQRIGLYNLI